MELDAWKEYLTEVDEVLVVYRIMLENFAFSCFFPTICVVPKVYNSPFIINNSLLWISNKHKK